MRLDEQKKTKISLYIAKQVNDIFIRRVTKTAILESDL